MQELTAANLDSIVADLTAQRTRWAATNQAERSQLLTELRASTYRVAERWAQVCCQIKGLDPSSPRAGEEWAVGPMIVLRNLRLLQDGLGRRPRKPKGPVRAFPGQLMDLLQWPGMWGHTWPGDSKVPRLPSAKGIVSLVLGAGNVSSIAATDVIYKLFVEDQVVLLKMNPIHDALGPVLEEAFAPLVRLGVLTIVSGDGKAGALACAHPGLEAIHITGSHKTYEAIVSGLKSPKVITSELGCVSPCIIAPGKWKERDLAYQARHVAGMLSTNAGFNCNAVQVLVTSKNWPQRQAFLDEIRRVLAALPPRVAYYPGAMERHGAFCAAYPQAQRISGESANELPWTLITELDPNVPQKAFQDEAFCGILHEVALDFKDEEYLLKAAEFVNEKLWGNLSASILIEPQAMKRQPWREAVRLLRYGAVGVNIWPGLVFALVNLPWGAYPGNTSADIQSGQGWVHNTAGVENPQKAVLRSAFWTPYAPPWHAGNSRMLGLARVLTDFEYKPGFLSLIKAHVEVLRGTLGK